MKKYLDRGHPQQKTMILEKIVQVSMESSTESSVLEMFKQPCETRGLLSGLGPTKGSLQQEAVGPQGSGGVNINVSIVLRRY